MITTFTVRGPMFARERPSGFSARNCRSNGAFRQGQNHLGANGTQVQVEKDADQLTVHHHGRWYVCGIKERSRHLPLLGFPGRPLKLMGSAGLSCLTKLLHAELTTRRIKSRRRMATFSATIAGGIGPESFWKSRRTIISTWFRSTNCYWPI